jgi:ABC-type branched-subunit amino acid transport system permease subunit
VPGPVLGAVALFVISELLWASYPITHMFLFGILIIGLVLFLPHGLWGLVRERTAKRGAAYVAGHR